MSAVLLKKPVMRIRNILVRIRMRPKHKYGSYESGSATQEKTILINDRMRTFNES
jgi:hypothetical protein